VKVENTLWKNAHLSFSGAKQRKKFTPPVDSQTFAAQRKARTFHNIFPYGYYD